MFGFAGDVVFLGKLYALCFLGSSMFEVVGREIELIVTLYVYSLEANVKVWSALNPNGLSILEVNHWKSTLIYADLRAVSSESPACAHDLSSVLRRRFWLPSHSSVAKALIRWTQGAFAGRADVTRDANDHHFEFQLTSDIRRVKIYVPILCLRSSACRTTCFKHTKLSLHTFFV